MEGPDAKHSPYDAVVVGSGPNGLAAAIELARAGRSVVVYEAAETVGGGMRSAELTLPGFIHDVCSTIHPLGTVSPFFRTLPLTDLGVEWIHPVSQAAHPMDDGSAALLERSLIETAAGFEEDGAAYRKLVAPHVRAADPLLDGLLAPVLRAPRHPVPLARFGPSALRSAAGLAEARFRTEEARALFGGMAAHAMLPLTHPPTGAIGLFFLMLGHAGGWPLVKGGSVMLAEALAAHLRRLGGDIVCGRRITALDELPASRAVLLDLTPQQVLGIAGDHLPARYREALARFRYGPGVFKIDWALSDPAPWRAPQVARSASVHVGGTLEEIAASEAAVARGEHPRRPFVIFVQQTPFDPSRAPAGRHTAWAYCHVPSGSTLDMTDRIEEQVERFAPGFRDCVLARSTMSSADLESYNENYVGGDINGGLQSFRQLFARPTLRPVPYATPNRRLYICSSSTPPGGGVHGMCGVHAARAALRRAF